jgi:hypothetical protein
MRRSRFWTAALGFTGMAALLASCNDAPTQGSTRGGSGTPSFTHVDPGAEHQGQAKGKGPTLHFARVSSDGGLVDGTAVSSVQSATGVYMVSFPTAVTGCAGSANAASFPGSGVLAAAMVTDLAIGVSGDAAVVVRTFFAPAASAFDTSFTLLLACP